MDAHRTGLFIAELRKEKGLTQRQLAELISVSDKAVSKWETGRGLPDVSLLKPLCEALGVSAGELLSGERLEGSQLKEKTDTVIENALRYSRRMLAKAAVIALFTVGAALLLSPLVAAGEWGGVWPLGLTLIMIAAALLISGRYGEKLRAHGGIAYGAAVFFAAAALALELLPFGAVLVFAEPDGTVTLNYSYFSITPFGFANFAPLLTGALTAAVLLLMLIAAISRRRGVKNAAFICTVICAGISLLPLLYGVRSMNFVSYSVTGALAVSAVIQLLANSGAENGR